MSELSTNVVMTVQAGPVANTPIDDTLEIEGAAADAKAVGDALALKADKSELANAITVNGQSADNQGVIVVNATQITMSDQDVQTVNAAITAAAARNASTIPMSGDAGADTIAEAIADTVKISEQELTSEQKSQARDNIGAASLAEVAAAVADKLAYVQLSSVSGGSSKTYTMANDTKAFFVAFGATLAVKGLWIVNLANASVTIADLASPSGLTMTAPSNGKVTIANSASVGARVYAIVFAGSVSDEEEST